jgi:hypothetical protein
MTQQMYGRTARSTTMHQLDEAGRPMCANKRISDQPMVNLMSLESVKKYGFLSVCSRCKAKAEIAGRL